MTTLAHLLLAPERHDRIVNGTATWVEQYVARRSGLRGLTLKAGLVALKAARPDALPRGVARLLPEFAHALEPLYQRFRASGERNFSQFLAQHSDEATAALLGVADARAAATSHRALASGYQRMRGTFEAELHALLPELAKVIAQYVA